MGTEMKTLVDKMEAARNYWEEKLSDITSETTFPHDNYRTGAFERISGLIEFEPGLSQKLLMMSKGNDLSLYVILLEAIKILVYRLSFNSDVIIASSKLNQGAGQPVGPLVLRDTLSGEMTFRELLLKVKETVSEAFRNQGFSGMESLRKIEKDQGCSFFRTIMLLDGINRREGMEELINSPENDTLFLFRRSGDKLECDFSCNAKVYNTGTARAITACLTCVAAQIAGNPDIKLKDIELVSAEQKNRIFSEFNNTGKVFCGEETLHRIFEKQARLDPDRPAICCMDENGISYKSYTYRELDGKADACAGALGARGVKEGHVVGIMLERSVHLAAAILGVLKTGAAYLPIDPELPAKRIKYMLEDSSSSLLITRKALLQGEKQDLHAGLLDMDAPGDFSGAALPGPGNPRGLAYVIYTSGSTGEPKGVMIEHRGLVNYIAWRINEYGLGTHDTALQLVSASFDGFCADFYSSLLSGGKLVLASDAHRKDLDAMSRLIEDMGITNASMIPAVYKGLLSCEGAAPLRSMRFVVLAGEKMDEELIKTSKEKYPGIALVNEYGPSENSVAATAFYGVTPGRSKIIGRPIANNRIYITDPNGSLMPVGMKGELCIGGCGLSRGYINKPDLTKERFVDDIFVPGEKMYRTGDAARWLDDGNIEFLGRIDHQLKIRGLRIEPGEIECQLVKHPLVGEASVAGWETENAGISIAACYEACEEVSAAELREFLLKVLPEYMVPAHFIWMKEIPRLPNGKIDRRNLPRPELDKQPGESPVDSDNDTLRIIEEVWREILGRDKIGLNDNFFEMGGDSLKAMQALVVLKKRGLQIEMKDLFLHPRIGELSGYVKKL